MTIHSQVSAVMRSLLATALLVLALGLAPSSATAQPAGFTMTDFDPDRYSFRFVNSWSQSLYVTAPIGGRVDLGSVGFGLCGGMTFAALDSYRTKRVVPQNQTTEPGPRSKIRQYVLRRQVESLALGNAQALRQFTDWQLRSLNDKKVLGITVRRGLKTLTRRQFVNQIRPRLRDGHPVPLGMVNVSGVRAPWENHQVLAIGFRNRPNNQATIAVYDPNYPISARNPDGITYLHTGSRRQTYTPSPNGQRVRSERFRGLFRVLYSQATPPRPPWTNVSAMLPS